MITKINIIIVIEIVCILIFLSLNEIISSDSLLSLIVQLLFPITSSKFIFLIDSGLIARTRNNN
ncbi:hypothetical protein BpHYR1_054079 [Brachionus plicatilis]|uniref:Uncharacterized protein n=1 Tax=Brachionus plicatilis TaxID=10195 RepID=A0A3M7PNI2_BRAPC|nr:hypothetical protein BpHYR1_054079 [Brachionus plicatilis]